MNLPLYKLKIAVGLQSAPLLAQEQLADILK